MMFGTRAPFDYFACDACGCVQLVSVPDDLSPYYPPEYHSFAATPAEAQTWRRALRRRRNAAVFTGGSSLGAALTRVFPYPVAGASDWFRRAGATKGSRILDVGCGAGALLADLVDAGFTRLSGVDPFIEHDIELGRAGRIQKGTIHDVDGEFDLIMLHHSLEHIRDQHATLTRVRELLAPDGVCLVRVPVASSWAWRHYGEHWVQLDAPRHLFVHSVASIELLSTAAGLTLSTVVHDSTELQFAGSELYRHDRPLTELGVAYSAAERRRLRARARALNAAGEGDQAAFYLRRADTMRTPLVSHSTAQSRP